MSRPRTIACRAQGRCHHDPGDPTERHLAEALHAAVLKESFTLDCDGAILWNTRSDVFTNGISNMSQPP
jgi:hypothetical protein